MSENQKSKIVNPQSPIKIVGIIGSGTMGSGIAQVAATAGCKVKLYDTNQAALDKAKASLEKILNRCIFRASPTHGLSLWQLLPLPCQSGLNPLHFEQFQKIVDKSHPDFLYNLVTLKA